MPEDFIIHQEYRGDEDWFAELFDRTEDTGEVDSLVAFW